MRLRKAVKNIIVFYRNYLSHLMLCKCRYYPTCSRYAIEAIDDRGVVRGILIALWRVIRCNPLFPGGYDPYIKKER